MPRKRTRSESELLRLKRPGLYAVGDGTGLRLKIERSGARTWVLRIKDPDTGSLHNAELGGFPQISLERARQRARDVLHIGDLASGLAEEPEQTLSAEEQRKQVQQLTGKPYGETLFVALEKAFSLPEPHQSMSIEHVARTLLEAWKDGEIKRFRERNVPDFRREHAIASLMALEIRRGRTRVEAASIAARCFEVKPKTANNYYSKRPPEDHALSVLVDVALRVEDHVQRGHFVEQAVRHVARQERLSTQFVQSAYEQARRWGLVKGHRASSRREKRK